MLIADSIILGSPVGAITLWILPSNPHTILIVPQYRNLCVCCDPHCILHMHSQRCVLMEVGVLLCASLLDCLSGCVQVAGEAVMVAVAEAGLVAGTVAAEDAAAGEAGTVAEGVAEVGGTSRK